MTKAYLNGRLVKLDDARVSVLDRGFIFADGVYEVIRFYGRQPYKLEEHLKRLEASAAAIEIRLNMGLDELNRISRLLVEESGLPEGIICIQITRGVAPRLHVFPDSAEPTVLVFTQAAQSPPRELVQNGAAAITVSDNRGGLCQVKTIGLLPNVLAKEKARRADAQEAIFVRQGLVTEGSSSNVFAVKEGALYTHPVANILPGITRSVVLNLAVAGGLQVREEAMFIDDFRRADEIFLSGTVVEILPVTILDGETVGNGIPGPVFRHLYDAFRREVTAMGATAD